MLYRSTLTFSGHSILHTTTLGPRTGHAAAATHHLARYSAQTTSPTEHPPPMDGLS